jgi:hypothetical protein
LVGRKLDDKLRLGGSMGDKQSQGQQAKPIENKNGGMEHTLEFRPNNSGNGQPGTAANSNGNQSTRSKSPGGHIINKISNFARGKYRNSLSEKQSNSISLSDDKVRKVCHPHPLGILGKKRLRRGNTIIPMSSKQIIFT